MARKAQIQMRRDTAANWTSTNPTLASGEIGFETDANRIKIGDGSTAWASLAYLTSAVGKNYLLNADFIINQRGFTSNTADSTYTFDRWLQKNIGGTVTSTPQTFTPGAAPVSGVEGKNYIQVVTASQSAVGDRSVITQKVEDVTLLAGRTVTVSFYAKASSGTPSIGVEAAQTFGTGGSPSAGVNIPLGSKAITTSWARYSVTGTISSVSGKTFGTTANTSNTEILLWLSAGSDFNTRASSIGIQNNTFSIWGVKVEDGSALTPFCTATGNIASELKACQRYYEKTFLRATVPANGGSTTTLTSDSGALIIFCNGATGYEGGHWPYKVTKRVSPTITVYGNSAGSWLYATSSTTTTSAGASSHSNSNRVYRYQTTNGSNIWMRGHFTADAEL